MKKQALADRMTIAVGSYVTHEKLPQLGSGEVISAHEGIVKIRFASGERAFAWDRVAANLAVTLEAPEPPAAAGKAKATKKAKVRGTTT